MSPKSSMGSFLTRLTRSNRASVTISPVSDHIFITGYGDEARGQFLRGKVSLFLPGNQKIRGVQLKMVGRRWLGDHKAKTEEEVKWQTSEAIVHQWDPFIVTDQVAQPTKNGRQYEWPFELFICGDQEESFKGCVRCSMTYLLEASAIQEDSLRSSYAFRPIRITRSPSFSSYELMDPTTVQGKWSGKAEYSVSIRHKAIALGGLIPIDAQVVQLSPNVKVTKARFYLREVHIICDKSVTGFSTYNGQRVVTDWPLKLDNQSPQGYSWQQCLHLPYAVRSCSPDFSLCGISISHTLHFEVTLDADGKLTEEEISMPIHLFVSPELPINGWGVFVRDDTIDTKESKNMLAEGIRIPPKYCKGDFGLDGYGTPLGTPPPAYSEI